jgi:hypothetical protein
MRILQPLTFGISVWIFLTVFPHLVSIGQDFDHYRPLRPEGEIPADFLLSSSERMQMAKQAISGESADKAIEESRDDFFEANAYMLNQLLQSGQVLFNDPVSQYLSEMLDYILKDEPGLRDTLRIYTVKSPDVNAFSTNNGILLVNMGLLAHLDNEAQLAFVLCHEISHFLKRHPLDIYLKAREIGNGKGIQRRLSMEESSGTQFSYTKEKEQEADMLGLELFLKTEYALEGVSSAFDMLKHSYLPFDERKLDPSFFDRPYLAFPESYFLDTVAAIGSVFNDSDTENSTHPRPDERKMLMKKALRSVDPAGRKLSIFGEDRFQQIRKVCRFETCHHLLLEQRYEEALYAAFLLSDADPGNQYLRKIMAHSLYMIARHANAGRFWEIHRDYGAMEGESQQLLHVLERFSDMELTLLALGYSWDLRREIPSDPELDQMTGDLIHDLGKFHGTQPGYFHTINDTTGANKPYAKALADLMQDSAFSEILSDQLAAGFEQYQDKRSEVSNLRKEWRKQQQLARRGFNLGLEKVVFVDPFYQRIDSRKEESIQYSASDQTQALFNQKIRKYADEVGLDYEILSSGNLLPGDIDRFNDIALLNDWINEKSYLEDLPSVSVNDSEVQYLERKYGTRYFVWTGGMALTRNRPARPLYLLGSPLIFPLFFYFKPRNDTFFYTMVYDIRTGKYLVLFPKYIRMKDKEDILNSAIYDLMLQIKSGN